MRASFLSPITLFISGLGIALTGQSLPGHLAGSASAPTVTQSLYVATLNKINVYSLGAITPRLIINQGLAGVSQIAVDSTGNCYAANFGTSPAYADSSVTQYAPGQTTPALTRTNGAFSAFGVAVDTAGDVFASSYYRNTVSVYRAGQANPITQITSGISGAGLLAVHRGQIYVGEFGTGQILEFPAGLTLNLKGPGTLPPGALTYGGSFAVGPQGAVYAGGAVVASDFGYEEFVNVFAPGATSPRTSVVVSSGPNASNPPNVAVAGGYVYVSVMDLNTVFQYKIGAQLQLVRTIASGLNQPGPIAVDANLNLYVGNAGGSMAVYPPGATTPSQTFFVPDFATPVAVVVR